MYKKTLLLCILLGYTLLATGQNVSDSLAIVSADWTVVPLQKGIVYKKAEIPLLYSAPQNITILEIDPDIYRCDVVVSSPKKETSVMARESKAVAAINGSFFNVKNGNSACYLSKDGVVVDTTERGALATCTTGAISIRKNKLKIIPWDVRNEAKFEQKRGTVLASGPLMLLDGKVCDLSSCNYHFVRTKHPRSAVGVTRKGTILLITVDGRFSGKAGGISIPELAHLIRVLGGVDALNLDGGGSSTLWYASAPDNGVLNKLSDNKTYDNRGERKVANALCIYE